MKYCADTWFLIELGKSEPKATKIVKNLGKHKNSLIIPSVVILELTRFSIRNGKKPILDELIKSIQWHQSIDIVDCDLKISKEAGELSANYNIPSVDSIIAATAIIHNCHRLISEDNHFQKLVKNRLIKLIKW
jgi:predicted nucleic acid-binding protein